MRLRRTIAMPIAAAVAAIAVVSAAAEGDQDLARHALENREVRPLAEILSGLRDRLGGELVGIELERKGGTWVYEFKIVGPAGRKSKILVDGKTGQIIGPEGD